MSTEMRASLIVTADVSSLSAQTRKAGTDYQALINNTTGLARQTKSAQNSFAAFENELRQTERQVDSLRAAYDPMFTANQRLVAGERALKLAMDQGQIELRERDQLLGALRAEYAATEAATKKLGTSMGGLTTMTRGGAGGMQNFAFQLQDVFTQVGMGVPIMVSLGQQAPQLLSGFGSVGAILGVVAAAALPLSAAIFGLGYNSGEAAEQAKTLEERLDDLRGMVDAYREALEQMSSSEADLSKQFGNATSQVRELFAAVASSSETKALEKLDQEITAIASAFEDLNDYDPVLLRQLFGGEAAIEKRVIEIFQLMDGLDQSSAGAEALSAELTSLFDASRGFPLVNQDISELSSTLGLAGDAALEVAARLLELQSAEGPTEQAKAAGLLRDALLASLGTYEDMNEAARELHDNLNTAQEEAVRLANAADAIAFSQAEQSASRVADELGRAVKNAIALANQGVGDLDRARINYEYRDDPIGRSRALAAAEFDASVGDVNGADRIIRDTIAEDRREFIAARVEAAEYTSALQQWRSEQSKATRSGSSSAKSSATAHSRAVAEIERNMARLSDSYAADKERLEAWRDTTLAALDPTKAGFAGFASDVEEIFNDRLAKAYDADLARRTDWAAGIERGLKDVNDDMMSWASVGEDIVTTWSTGLEDAFASMAMTGKASVDDLVDHTLEQLLRLAYQQAVQPAVNGVFDFLSSGIGGLFGGASGAAPATLSASYSHAGSQIGRDALSTSRTGLRSDEQLTVTKLGQRVFTPRQIENGSAVVDALAMAAQSSQNTVVSMPVTINNYTEAQVEARQTADGGLSFDVMGQVERSMASRMQQRGSPLNRAVQSAAGPRHGLGQR